MTGYRFLSPAEEEMTEAAVFYESSSAGLGSDFLDDVQRAIDRLSDYPRSGEPIEFALDVRCYTAFHSVSSTQLNERI